MQNFLSALVLIFVQLNAWALDTGEIYIRWRGGSDAERREVAQNLGLQVQWASPLVNGLARYRVLDSATTSKALHILNADRRVVYAEPNFAIRRTLPQFSHVYSAQDFHTLHEVSAARPNDPMLASQWALTTAKGVHAIEAWDAATQLSNIRVAVIDTGIDATHPDLAGKVLPGYDFINNTTQVLDGHGHGTHVAGIIGARSNNGIGIVGISPELSFIPIRAIPADADEKDSDVIAAFEFAARSGARVVNCSFGKSESSQAVGDTIEAIGRQGVLVVVAAGNDGQNNNQASVFPANFRTSNMVVVASIAESGKLSFFSNYGLGKVDLAAPGSNILSTITSHLYASWSGTSMAAPQVSGVAALTLSVNPSLSVARLRDLLLSSATKEASLSGKVDTGARIDAVTAVNAARKMLVSTDNP